MVVERLAVRVQRSGVTVLEESCCFAREPDREGDRYELLVARRDFVALQRVTHDDLEVLLLMARQIVQASGGHPRRARPGLLRFADRVSGDLVFTTPD